MKNKNENKKEIFLLPCYEHDIREYVKRCNAHISLTPVYQLTPEEEKAEGEEVPEEGEEESALAITPPGKRD